MYGVKYIGGMFHNKNDVIDTLEHFRFAERLRKSKSIPSIDEYMVNPVGRLDTERQAYRLLPDRFQLNGRRIYIYEGIKQSKILQRLQNERTKIQVREVRFKGH